MSSAKHARAQGSSPRSKPPTGRILSAATYAAILESEQSRRTKEDGRIDRLPSLHEQARLHGYQQGMRSALFDIKSTLQELKHCREDREHWLQDYVFAVLRKVLGTQDDTQMVSAIVQTVIEECGRSLESVAVHVHPSAAEAVAKRLRRVANKSLRIDIVSDDGLSETACELHTAFGIIDAGLDTQLDALQHALCVSNGENADD